MQSYLHNHLQRANVNSDFSIWKRIFPCVQNGSMHGPIMINIYINDTFLFAHNVCLINYADDTTLSSIGGNHNTNTNILNNVFYPQKCFHDDYMVLKQGKCSYMSFGSNPDKSDLN